MADTVATETKPSAPPVDKLKVKVDGKEVEVPKTMPDPLSGKPLPTTMIQACAVAKVDVPHYCYHPKLPVTRFVNSVLAAPPLAPASTPILTIA